MSSGCLVGYLVEALGRITEGRAARHWSGPSRRSGSNISGST